MAKLLLTVDCERFLPETGQDDSSYEAQLSDVLDEVVSLVESGTRIQDLHGYRLRNRDGERVGTILCAGTMSSSD